MLKDQRNDYGDRVLCAVAYRRSPLVECQCRGGMATTTEIDGWLPWSLAKDHRLEGATGETI